MLREREKERRVARNRLVRNRLCWCTKWKCERVRLLDLRLRLGIGIQADDAIVGAAVAARGGSARGNGNETEGFEKEPLRRPPVRAAAAAATVLLACAVSVCPRQARIREVEAAAAGAQWQCECECDCVQQAAACCSSWRQRANEGTQQRVRCIRSVVAPAGSGSQQQSQGMLCECWRERRNAGLPVGSFRENCNCCALQIIRAAAAAAAAPA